MGFEVEIHTKSGKIYIDKRIEGATEEEVFLNAMKYLASIKGGPILCHQCQTAINLDAGEIECPNGCISNKED